MADESSPPCSCEAAGFCNRYGRNVTPQLHSQCQRDPKFRRNRDKYAASQGVDAVERAAALASLMAEFAEAAAEWSRAGFPTRPPEEVLRIYREVCHRCPHFEPHPGGADEGTCGRCRCRLAPKFDYLFNIRNAIGWATKGCPDSPPRWLPVSQDRPNNGGGCGCQ